MLKYLTHKLRTQSINEDNVQEKIDGHDSGTESDGDLTNRDDFDDEHEMELSTNSRHDTILSSPTDTVGSCSTESPLFLAGFNNNNSSNIMYDQHSSEEELEVINGPTKNNGDDDIDEDDDVDEDDRDDDEISEVFDSPKRRRSTSSRCSSTNSNGNATAITITTPSSSATSSSSSTITNTTTAAIIIENRKRSLAQSSDDEVRHLLNEQVPLNFRTSPPLEALKPHRSGGIGGCGHILLPHRAATPLILTDTGRGIESINISYDHNNYHHHHHHNNQHPTAGGSSSSSSSSAAAISSSIDVISISPPTKLFHCAMSPRRRLPRHHLSASQRLQRPHNRPCLDFDKMQQLKARSMSSWRYNTEHPGEFSVFCW